MLQTKFTSFVTNYDSKLQWHIQYSGFQLRGSVIFPEFLTAFLVIAL